MNHNAHVIKYKLRHFPTSVALFVFLSGICLGLIVGLTFTVFKPYQKLQESAECARTDVIRSQTFFP